MSHRLQILALTALAVGFAACGGGGGGSSPTAPVPQNLTVQVLDFEFSPKSLTINPGDTVTWVLDGDDKTHTSTSREPKWDSDFVFINQGDRFVWTSTAADAGMTYDYSCKTHTDTHEMKGAIRVGANAPPPSSGYG